MNDVYSCEFVERKNTRKTLWWIAIDGLSCVGTVGGFP